MWLSVRHYKDDVATVLCQKEVDVSNLLVKLVRRHCVTDAKMLCLRCEALWAWEDEIECQFCYRFKSTSSWMGALHNCLPFVRQEGRVLRPKMNCGVGLVNCFFLWVPLACLGSMVEGSRAGTSGELGKNSLPNLLHSWFWDVVETPGMALELLIPNSMK